MNRRNFIISSALSSTLLLAKGVKATTVEQVDWRDYYSWYYKTKTKYKGWRYIVLHHSATAGGSYKAFHKYHTEKGYGGCCYHYVIGNGKGSADGLIEKSFRWTKQMSGTHCTVNSWIYNIFGIGICLVGNFYKYQPTIKQKQSLAKLVRFLRDKYRIPAANIIRHKDVPFDDGSGKTEQTICPGKNFPYLTAVKA